MSILLLILGLVLFVSLVIVHELGHFIAARRNDVEVEEFGIGFPPRVWGKRLKSGLLVSLNALPLGGFVRLKGEQDADKQPGSYGRANLSAKTKIMLAGVGMNLLTAFLFLTVLAWLGMPKLINNQFTVDKDTRVIKNQVLVGFIEEDSPAKRAGLQVRDQLLSLGPISGQRETVTTQEALPELTQKYAGQTVQLSVERSGAQKVLSIRLRSAQEIEDSKKNGAPKGYLGVSPTEYTLRRSTWSAPIVAAGLIKQFTVLTFQGLGHAIGALFQGNATTASEQVAGPVGIFVLLKDGSLLGYQFVLMIISIISLTLAIMNVLPIPALDGGRLFVTWLFRIIRKPLTKRMEETIHGTGFALLMTLFVLITIVDVRRFF